MILFSEVVSLVPEYMLLQPGVEMREGDEILHQSTLGSRWIEPFRIRDAMLNYLKVSPDMIVRRKISTEVREGIALEVFGYINDPDSTLHPHFEQWVLGAAMKAMAARS